MIKTKGDTGDDGKTYCDLVDNMVTVASGNSGGGGGSTTGLSAVQAMENKRRNESIAFKAERWHLLALSHTSPYLQASKVRRISMAMSLHMYSLASDLLSSIL